MAKMGGLGSETMSYVGCSPTPPPPFKINLPPHLPSISKASEIIPEPIYTLWSTYIRFEEPEMTVNDLPSLIFGCPPAVPLLCPSYAPLEQDLLKSSCKAQIVYIDILKCVTNNQIYSWSGLQAIEGVGGDFLAPCMHPLLKLHL